MDEKPRVIDAEFEVIEDPRADQSPKLRWWEGWYIDWRIPLVAGAIAAASAWPRPQG